MTVSGVTILNYILYLYYVNLYFLKEEIANLRSDTTRKPKDNFAALNNIWNGGIFLLGGAQGFIFPIIFRSFPMMGMNRCLFCQLSMVL